MNMTESNQGKVTRVLIISANPLFARGLENLLSNRWSDQAVEVRLESNLTEAMTALESWQPELVIVDYDDRNIQRAAFLSHFISGDQPMKVMLVSLRESGEVVVYDRRTLTPAQAENWLDLPWTRVANVQEPPVPEPVRKQPQQVSETHLSPRSGGMKHYVIAGVLAVVLTFVMSFLLQSANLFLVPASSQAGPVDQMIRLQLWIISFLFSLVTVFILYSAFVFRRRRGDQSAGTYFKANNSLEIIWTILPLGLVIVLAMIGAKDLADIRKADPDALEVKVTAFQWGWSFEYPDYGIQGNQLYLPVNRQVHLSMTSRDVIHSFWVPEFRIKQDVLPGENLVKELRINPTRVGNYQVMCAELCGGSHAYMNAAVNVVSQQDFDAWVAEQSDTSSLTPAQRGEKVSQTSGCTGCHSLNGAKLPGPTWKGLAGESVKLTDGSTVVADDTYLKKAIVDPNAEIVEGYTPNLMPQTYKTQLSDQQINDLVEFMKSVK